MLQPAHTSLYQHPGVDRGQLFSALVQGRPLVAWNQPSAIIHGSPHARCDWGFLSRRACCDAFLSTALAVLLPDPCCW